MEGSIRSRAMDSNSPLENFILMDLYDCFCRLCNLQMWQICINLSMSLCISFHKTCTCRMCELKKLIKLKIWVLLGLQMIYLYFALF